MKQAMIEAEADKNKDVMIEIEEDTLLSEENPEVITIQEGHTESKIITEIEVPETTKAQKSINTPYQRT